MVSREVLEVLAEESRIREGHHGSVLCYDLRALVGDAVYGSPYAVALDDVTDSQPSAHQLYAVEEVVEDILEGESDTGGETRTYNRYGGSRDLEHQERDDDEEAPADKAYYVVGEVEVEVRLLEHLAVLELGDSAL